MRGPDCQPAQLRRRVLSLRATLTHVCASALLLIGFTVGLGLTTGSLIVSGAHAETLNDRLAGAGKNKSKEPDRLLVQADELIYDKDRNTVSAKGNARLYYQGRILQADIVTYDRAANRVRAEGHAKLTEADGTVAYGERFDLTDDFKNGFIDSLHANMADKTYFTSNRVERAEGDTSVFERGTYTACEPCKDDPSKPPTWQIRAKRIIHKNDEQTIYYEDAVLELWGLPVAYFPYFSSPDPTVKRKSGFLSPVFSQGTQSGYGVGMSYFWAIAPDYDLTLTPTYYSKQGLLGEAEWRQKFVNGAYKIRAAGIFQKDPGIFSPAPSGPGNRTFRGEIETDGKFYINDKWKFGWSVALTTDNWFQTNYRLPGEDPTSWYNKERGSNVFLIGQGDRGLFELNGYYFQPMTAHDLARQQPLVAPVVDYNKTVDLDPAKSWGIGGQLEVDANFTHLTRELAAYQSVGARQLDPTYQLFDVCATYTRSTCLLRGIGGDYSRATINLTWKRKFVDSMGNVWTPFTFAHLSGSMLNQNSSNSQYGISNANQATFAGSQDTSFRGQAVPGVGLEWRLPLIARTEWATHVLEPIAQIIVRPNETTNRALVNEDAQSLVFDDTNLFEWNRFSGYDRFEGGTRVNYGAQYSLMMNNGAYANFMFGQSYQLAGQNSYSSPDAANIGLDSGLDRRMSDYIGRVLIAPNSTFSFIAKTRLDVSSFQPRRIDLIARASFAKVDFNVQYARYESQQAIGFAARREGLSVGSKYKINENWYLNSNVVFDMSHHLQPNSARSPLFTVAGLGVGAGYTDDCTTLSVNYVSAYQDNGTGTNTLVRNQTIVVQLQLRTLGGATVKSGIGSNSTAN